MNLLTLISNLLNPPAQSFEALAAGTCVLPLPVTPRRAVKQESKEESDMFAIDEAAKVYGWNSAKAARQKRGIKQLTDVDIEILSDRDLWGKVSKVRAQNATCKAHWHNGLDESECAANMALSKSWVEKRYAAFNSALSGEDA